MLTAITIECRSAGCVQTRSAVPEAKRLMPDTAVATQESIALLALASLGGVGYRTLYSIFKSGKRFQDLVGADSVKGLSASLKAAGVRQPKAVAERIFSEGLRLLPKGEALLADLNARNIRLLHHFEPEFPPMYRCRDRPTTIRT